MEPLYSNLEEKFIRILSGVCLTTLRDENSKITRKYDSFDASKTIQMREDYGNYLANYLFLKGYDSVNLVDSVLVATKEGEDTEFLIDFDHGGNDSMLKLNVLSKGVKQGISESESKYVFIVSVEKALVVLMNCENLKNHVREKHRGFGMLSESDGLFKSQYVTVDLSQIGRKAKVFSLK